MHVVHILQVITTVFSPSQIGFCAITLACVVTSCGDSWGNSLGWVCIQPSGSISWKHKSRIHISFNMCSSQQQLTDSACSVSLLFWLSLMTRIYAQIELSIPYLFEWRPIFVGVPLSKNINTNMVLVLDMKIQDDIDYEPMSPGHSNILSPKSFHTMHW